MFQTAKHIHLSLNIDLYLSFIHLFIYFNFFIKQGVLLSKHTAFRPSPVLVYV